MVTASLEKRRRAPPNLVTILACVLFVCFCAHSFSNQRTVDVLSPSSSSTISSSETKKSSTCQDVKRRIPQESATIFQSFERNKEYVKNNGLTFIEAKALKYHADNIDKLERNGIPGVIIECGVAKAGSSVLFATMKDRCRELHLHDTFEGIPQPSDRDGSDIHERYRAIQADKAKCQQGRSDCDKNYYGNMENLLEFDKRQFTTLGFDLKEHNIYFHKGLFDDTVWPQGPVAYAHLDGDWYDSTKNMLERIAPYLSVGGYFVLDDVFAWSGARDAFSDFFGVNVEWLKQQPQKSCYVETAGKHFKVFLSDRAAAQVLPWKDGTITPCVS